MSRWIFGYCEECFSRLADYMARHPKYHPYKWEDDAATGFLKELVE